ncbi:hypothetical protein ACRBEH_17845 [Vibrio cholerae]|uniref:Uncharacterized protein n=1 Tax=Vibrio cholerae TaxID=666 RepID=A0ABD7SPD8_VIBCL|nr:hypothetical protein [Vibrio cholerae]TXX66717.1 hypothetical protein FXF03_05335 [Vibrio cholerae]GIB01927.1 hypothetical protein VCSRO136_2977 [Vibrio cholerae]
MKLHRTNLVALRSDLDALDLSANGTDKYHLLAKHFPNFSADQFVEALNEWVDSGDALKSDTVLKGVLTKLSEEYKNS